MADQDIEISISSTGADAVAADLNNISKKAEGMGSSVKSAGAIGKLGLWSLGEQAEKAATSLGIPHKIGRQLGNTIESLSMTLGTAATAFGVVGLAATAGYAIYTTYTERQKEAREETEKNTSKLLEQTKALYDNKLETEGVLAAKKLLAQHSREQYLEESSKQIKNLTEDLDKAKKKLSEVDSSWAAFWAMQKANFTSSSASEFHAKEAAGLKTVTSELQKNVTALEDKLRLTKEERKAASKKPEDYNLSDEAMKGLGEGYAAQAETTKLEASYTRQATYLTKVDALWSAQDSNYSGHLDMQQAALDAQLQAKLTSMQANNATMEEYQQAWEDYVLASETKIAQSRKTSWTSALDTSTSILSMMAETENNYYSASNSTSKTHWRRYKQLKIAEATVSGVSSVMKAYDEGSKWGGPYVGAAYAAIAAAWVASKISSIRSTNFDGDSTSSSSTSTSSSSTTAGMSGSSQSSQPVNIYINGQRYSSLEITGSVVRELYRRGGSIDGYSVTVGKNA